MRDGLELDDGLDVIEAHDLWSTKEIAAAWKLNREYVTDVLTKRPDFPEPALNLSRKTRRWKRIDCEAFRQRNAGR